MFLAQRWIKGWGPVTIPKSFSLQECVPVQLKVKNGIYSHHPSLCVNGCRHVCMEVSSNVNEQVMYCNGCHYQRERERERKIMRGEREW